MKKIMLSFGIAITVIILSGCTNRIDMKSIHNEPHFAGVVVEVFDGSILVSVNEGEAIRNSSYLVFVSPQDSESLNIEAFEDVYEFVMRTSEHFSWDEENKFTVHDAGDIFVFHYGRIGSAWYLLFGEVWYEVKNPSNIIFPIKLDPIVFEPAVILEAHNETNDTNAHALSFTIQEWYGEADNAIEPIYTDSYYVYELSQIRSHLIMLTFDDGRQMSLRDALYQRAVGIDELVSAGLRVSKRELTLDDIPTQSI